MRAPVPTARPDASAQPRIPKAMNASPVRTPLDQTLVMAARPCSSDAAQHVGLELDRLRCDQDEADDAGFRATVDPVMNRAPLDEDVALLEPDHDAVVQLHVDLAGHDHGVIDRLGAMVARG